MRPEWWNEIHDRALSALTDKYQRAPELMKAAGVPFAAFEDLVTAKCAVVLREPLYNGRTPAGEAVWFMLSPKESVA